jgi:Male sterility protein
MKLQRKIFEANKALKYFITNNWNFENDNFQYLGSLLRSEDVRDFEYHHDFYRDKVLAARYTILGYRRYLLKQKDETLPRCQKTFFYMNTVNKMIKAMFYAAAFYIIFMKFKVMQLFER